jgi:hypothetical protein
MAGTRTSHSSDLVHLKFVPQQADRETQTRRTAKSKIQLVTYAGLGKDGTKHFFNSNHLQTLTVACSTDFVLHNWVIKPKVIEMRMHKSTQKSKRRNLFTFMQTETYPEKHILNQLSTDIERLKDLLVDRVLHKQYGGSGSSETTMERYMLRNF